MRPSYPPRNDSSKIVDFLDYVMTHENSYWLDQFSTWEKARLYVKRNQQYIERDYTEDVTRTPFWSLMQVDENNWSPMPTHNEMIGPIQNEAARLQGNGSRPYIRPTDDTPKMQRAAKLGRDALVSKLDELHWREIEHEGCDEMVTYGNWIIKGWWDVDHTRTFKAPVTTALKCPRCDFMVASASVPEKRVAGLMTDPRTEGRLAVRALTDANNPLVPPRFSAQVTHCLTCEEGMPTLGAAGEMIAGEPVPEVEPYVPTSDEAKTGKDFFKRPLGEDMPLGDIAIKNVSVFDWRPENHGVVRYDGATEHGEERVESLDWVANHHPDKAADVRAMDASAMMRWHPIVGPTRYSDGAAGHLFSNHTIIREWHKEPWVEVDRETGRWKLNRGRSLIVAGGKSDGCVVLLDGDYMVEEEVNGETRLLPRVVYFNTPWEIRTGEAFGLSGSELLFSQQDSLNLLVAQVQDTRHRFGSPALLCEEGMDLMYAGFSESGVKSDILYYRPGVNENAKPEPFGNEQMDQNWVAEYAHYTDSMSRTMGTMDAEIGAVPGGGASEWSAQALMYMGEKSSERRKNRLDRIREMKKRLYKFMLEWMQARYVEDRQYTVKTENERLSVRAFKGVDLCDQTDVQIDDEPAYDTKMVRRAAIADAFKAGTIIADTAAAKRKINRELGAPLDINEDQNKQVERACDEFLAYYEDGLTPAVNMRADDHLIHFQQHMVDLMGDDAERLREEVDWNQIELAIWGWQDDFEVLMAAEADLKANPLPAQPMLPQPNPVSGQVEDVDVAAEAAMWQKRKQMADQIAAMPRALELRIFEFMWKQLEATGVLNVPAPDIMVAPGAPPAVQVDKVRAEKVRRIMRFIAHAEAHYRLSQKQAQAATAGVAQPSAPGGLENSRGMVPGQNAGAIPGAGAGPGAATAGGSGGPVS